ncbi:M48 family metallopeptidase [Tessaracoccus sp. Z1128]
MPRGSSKPSALLRVAGIEAEVTYKAIRNLRVRVLPPDGRVAVSVPVGVPESAVREFVAGHSEWIAVAQTRVRMATPPREPLVDGGRARLWGLWYELRTEAAARASAVVEGRTIVLSGPDEDGLRRALEALYRRQLDVALPALRARWEPRVGRRAGSIRLRRMTTRWGTCNTTTAAVTFNIALAEHHPSALEYVLVHELVHLHERGHGPRFVSWMDSLLPDWRERRKSLRGRA